METCTLLSILLITQLALETSSVVVCFVALVLAYLLYTSWSQYDSGKVDRDLYSLRVAEKFDPMPAKNPFARKRCYSCRRYGHIYQFCDNEPKSPERLKVLKADALNCLSLLKALLLPSCEYFIFRWEWTLLSLVLFS